MWFTIAYTHSSWVLLHTNQSPFANCLVSSGFIYFPFILCTYTCYSVVCQPPIMIDQQQREQEVEVSTYRSAYLCHMKAWKRLNEKQQWETREKSVKLGKYLLFALRSPKITNRHSEVFFLTAVSSEVSIICLRERKGGRIALYDGGMQSSSELYCCRECQTGTLQYLRLQKTTSE